MSKDSITFSKPEWGDLQDEVVVWTTRRKVLRNGEVVGYLFGYAAPQGNPMRSVTYEFRTDNVVEMFMRLDEARGFIPHYLPKTR